MPAGVLVPGRSNHARLGRKGEGEGEGEEWRDEGQTLAKKAGSCV